MEQLKRGQRNGRAKAIEPSRFGGTGMESKTKDQIKLHIRWMIRRDMPEVLSIESGCFDHPWTEEDFLQALRQRNCIGMVAEHEERVIGFMIYELHRTRLHPLNFGVHSGYRRLGVGKQMINKLLTKLSHHRRTRVTLAVREGNLTAQLFFKKQSFVATKVLRKFYSDSGEDAYLMQFHLANAELEEDFVHDESSVSYEE